MLEIIFGSSGKSPLEVKLRETIQELNPTGTLYFSYPIFEDAKGQSSADALLVSDEYGLVVLDLSASRYDLGRDPNDWIEEINFRQDEIFRNIQRKLFSNRDLVEKRTLVVVPEIITVLHEIPDCKFGDDLNIVTPDSLADLVTKFEPFPKKYKRALNASIQRIPTIKPRMKRTNVKSASSYGHALQEIEKQIANLDAWQQQSAINFPEGPQRIRGLAGSGKTIVLALKAAYLHAKYPEWNIVVSYYSKALRQQFRDLIRRFMFETTNDEPDWTKIQVIHSWGSVNEPGLYSEIAQHCDVQPVSWREANSRYGNRAFDGICKDVLDCLKKSNIPDPKYDVVLIDESQDLPASFFRLIYAATRRPKRIVWAYDELQNLGAYNMASPEELFGRNKFGQPRVELLNKPDRPKQDIILPICYRNTPWALTVAHGIGFGLYRNTLNQGESPIVQMFDDPKLWKEIGYEVIHGALELGSQVSVRRDPNNTPDYYSDRKESLIQSDDAIKFETFSDSIQQAEWIARDIKLGLEEQELVHEDFLIVLPNALTARSEYGYICDALRKYDIPSHLVGIVSGLDEVFQGDSIAVTHIFRAKGNEAPMVYFLNSHECYDGFQLARKRNILFTGITRSRAWVRVCGVGKESTLLTEEFMQIADSNFNLNFDYPTESQLKGIRRIHRDRFKEEQRKFDKRIDNFSETIGMIKSGELPVSAMPHSLQEDVRRIKQAQ